VAAAEHQASHAGEDPKPEVTIEEKPGR